MAAAKAAARQLVVKAGPLAARSVPSPACARRGPRDRGRAAKRCGRNAAAPRRASRAAIRASVAPRSRDPHPIPFRPWHSTSIRTDYRPLARPSRNRSMPAVEIGDVALEPLGQSGGRVSAWSRRNSSSRVALGRQRIATIWRVAPPAPPCRDDGGSATSATAPSRPASLLGARSGACNSVRSASAPAGVRVSTAFRSCRRVAGEALIAQQLERRAHQIERRPDRQPDELPNLRREIAVMPRSVRPADPTPPAERLRPEAAFGP